MKCCVCNAPITGTAYRAEKLYPTCYRCYRYLMTVKKITQTA